AGRQPRPAGGPDAAGSRLAGPLDLDLCQDRLRPLRGGAGPAVPRAPGPGGGLVHHPQPRPGKLEGAQGPVGQGGPGRPPGPVHLRPHGLVGRGGRTFPRPVGAGGGRRPAGGALPGAGGPERPRGRAGRRLRFCHQPRLAGRLGPGPAAGRRGEHPGRHRRVGGPVGPARHADRPHPDQHPPGGCPGGHRAGRPGRARRLGPLRGAGHSKMEKNYMNERASGILMPVSSLPGPYGIGCFSQQARAFVDWLVQAGQTFWQILPLGPTSYGDSPYQSFSTFAGNPYFVDLQTLVQEGLLDAEACREADFGSDPGAVDYGRLYQSRLPLLRQAFRRWQALGGPSEPGYRAFLTRNAPWLEDYALFMALKARQGGAAWDSWPQPLRMRQPEALAAARAELAGEMDFHRFVQYQFEAQWQALKAYANGKGVRIIGDIPIYVAFDSADTWAHPELFQLDGDRRPTGVAGVPPDGF